MISIRSATLLTIASTCIILTAVNYFTIRTTSSVRAYINGESHYSKGQKDASNHLILYLATEDISHWSEFERHLSIPIGDSLARVQLEKKGSLSLIRSGLLQGKNHPEDIDNLIWMYHTFRNVSFMDKAIQIWKKADALNGLLYSKGLGYHQIIQSGQMSNELRTSALKGINQLSQELTLVEEEFSSTLGATARIINKILFATNFFLVIVLIGTTGRYTMISLKKLTAANQLRNDLLNAAFEAIVWYDKESTISYWNPQAEHMFGWKKEDILGKKLTDTIIPEEYRAQHKKGIQNYLKTGSQPLPIPKVDTFLKDRFGKNIPVELSILPLNRENPLFCANIFDISKRRQLEQRQLERQSYLKAILDSTNDGIIATSKAGEIIEVSQRFADLWQIPLEYIESENSEKIAEIVLDQLHDSKGIQEEIIQLYASDKTHTRFLNCKDGRIFERHSVPMILGKKAVGRVWSFRDITDQKKAEARYRNLFDNSAEGIYIGETGGNGRLINVNPAMASMYGYDSPQEMIEMVTEPGEQLFVDQEDRLAIRKILERNGEALGVEYRSMKKNGEIFWVRNHLRFVFDNHGKPTHFEGSIENITTRKRAQDQLVQQIDELRKVNFELDRFVYSVSHDLRAPLLSIKGLVNISEVEKPSPTLMKYLDMIRTSVNRLDKFIMDILDYSRNSRLEIKNERIDFEEIINDLINNLGYLDGYQRLKITHKVALKSDFFSDKRRIEVILGNLISNAIKYQDFDKKDSEIDISIIESDDLEKLTITVFDNGIGIDPNNQDKIFDMFYRASDRSKGAGLGLYIIKETIETLNGSIKLTSTPKVSTCFEILLPARVAQPTELI